MYCYLFWNWFGGFLVQVCVEFEEDEEVEVN